MNHKKKGKVKSKFRSRVFFALLVIVIIPVLIFGGITYMTYMDETEKRSDMAMDAAGERVKDSVVSVLTGIREYYMELSERNEVMWLLDQKEVPYTSYTDVNNVQKLLQGNYSIMNLISEYTFYNQKYGWILSNGGMYPVEEMKNYDQFKEFVDGQENGEARVYWYNKMPEEQAEGNVREAKTVSLNGLFLITWLFGSDYREGVLFAKVNVDKLISVANQLKEDYEVSFYTKDRKLLFSTDEGLNQASQEFFRDFDAGLDKTYIKTDEKNRYRMNIYPPSGDGLYCVIGYNVDRISDGGDRILFALGISIAILLGVFMVCFYVSERISRPVNELVHSVQVMLGAEKDSWDGLDEFSYLENGVEELVTNRENMRKLISSQQMVLMDLFLDHMIRGELPQEEIDKNLAQFGLEKQKCYRLLAVVCLLEEGKGEFADLEKEAVNMMIVNQIPMELKEMLFLSPISYGEEILMVIGAMEEEKLQEKVLAVYGMITDYVQEAYKCSVAVGGSLVFHKLKHMRTAYHEAIETLRNEATKLYFDENAVAFYEDFADSEYIKNGYDTVREKMLTDAVDQCDKEATFRFIDQFVDRLKELNIVRHERSYYLYRMIVAVLNVPSNAGLSVNHIFKNKVNDIFGVIKRPYDSDKLKGFLKKEMAEPIIDALIDYRHSYSSDIMEGVVKLIKESQGNITLAECAEKMNYHPSYIWKVLKAEGNMTFTDLINMEKLDVAKKMLLESNASVAEIAEKLHYSNTQNFIRFFSKYVGSTPGKYRKENQIQRESLAEIPNANETYGNGYKIGHK